MLTVDFLMHRLKMHLLAEMIRYSKMTKHGVEAELTR